MESGVTVKGIQPHELEVWWSIAVCFLTEAIDEYSDLTVSFVHNELAAQRLALFMVFRDGVAIGAAVTEVVDAPARKKVDVVLVGGSQLSRWIGFIDSIANWYKQSGCQVIELRSRPGFAKLLKPYGFSPSLIMLRRKL